MKAKTTKNKTPVLISHKGEFILENMMLALSLPSSSNCSSFTWCYIKRCMCHFTLSILLPTSQCLNLEALGHTSHSHHQVFKVTWEVAPFEIFTHNVRTGTATRLTVDLNTVCAVTAGFSHTSTVQGYCEAVKSHQHAGTCCTCVACKALWDMFSDPWQVKGWVGGEA